LTVVGNARRVLTVILVGGLAGCGGARHGSHEDQASTDSAPPRTVVHVKSGELPRHCTIANLRALLRHGHLKKSERATLRTFLRSMNRSQFPVCLTRGASVRFVATHGTESVYISVHAPPRAHLRNPFSSTP
jgi:type IV pilus biogenesis protein CpaD/CtpE